MIQRRSAWRRILLLVMFVGIAACDDKRRHQPSSGVTLSTEQTASMPADAPPDRVAKAMLDSLCRFQRARAAGLGTPQNKQAYDAAMAQIWSLAAGEDIRERLIHSRSPTIPRSLSVEAALTLMAESWASLIAHYVEGIHPDGLQLNPPNPRTAAVGYLEAMPSADGARLDQRGNLDSAGDTKRTQAIANGLSPLPAAGITIRLLQVGESWRVSQVDLGPARTAVDRPPTTSAPARQSTAAKS